MTGRKSTTDRRRRAGAQKTGAAEGSVLRIPPRPDGHGYPRPQLQRSGWISLNGDWDFAIDADAVWESPSRVSWSRKIRIPYAL